MSVHLELERTFLAQSIPGQIGGAPSEPIFDTYIPETADHARLRLRQKGDIYELTKKEPAAEGDSSQQTEHTVPLSRDEYDMFKTLSSKSLRKLRFYTTFYGHKVEIDVFQGDLEGLVLIEFEFDSAEAMKNFQPPEVCLAEVTQDPFSAGGKLAGKRFSELERELGKYHYQPLFMDREAYQGEVSV